MSKSINVSLENNVENGQTIITYRVTANLPPVQHMKIELVAFPLDILLNNP